MLFGGRIWMVPVHHPTRALRALRAHMLHLSPGNQFWCCIAPKLSNAATAICYIAWHDTEFFFPWLCDSLPSSSSLGSDHVVPPVFLPNPPQPERRTEQGHWWCLYLSAGGVCLSATICATGCVCMYICVVDMCTCLWTIHAQPCCWLVLESWSCNSPSLLSSWIW